MDNLAEIRAYHQKLWIKTKAPSPELTKLENRLAQHNQAVAALEWIEDKIFNARAVLRRLQVPGQELVERERRILSAPAELEELL